MNYEYFALHCIGRRIARIITVIFGMSEAKPRLGKERWGWKRRQMIPNIKESGTLQRQVRYGL
ncbi:uncharacterized protein MYCFIDRAFT_211915 [Pseudocercospora fijiensis CIRAD86]|uniref:Uncharacterized protein n=1 Tax=Pseudocercospora fijiensis (strain CIRAD86) TaxID=383855 RepID=M3AS38_PSEFD|nr:uncharacterized protein MYCFIDRAFT_211915 [Pseudocercospora fijiensis CIRAD86]EME79948.1 hypothetical protein MYCFIDRAFT_211915 [Pseudocercospora fijiensis CIRAD86]